MAGGGNPDRLTTHVLVTKITLNLYFFIVYSAAIC